MRSILEAYYEPQFSPNSHGFRPQLGCHTALRDIYRFWTGAKWFIEGDIKGCFDNIDHTVLMSILREKIHDNRFLVLVNNLLKAGYLENWNYRPTLSGTPQGGIISPILANIYLDRLDKFVEQKLVPEFTKGRTRRWSTEYVRLKGKIRRLKAKGADDETLAPLIAEKKKTRCIDNFDPTYRRLNYIRYADDFILGFAGPKEEAELIKIRLQEFLRDNLKLELSAEKTKITNAGDEKARFLGYDISGYRGPIGKKGYGGIMLRVPAETVQDRAKLYLKNGYPVHRVELTTDSDFTIVERYGSEYRGIVQYYAYAQNRFWFHFLHWAMRYSLLKTLANKHKSTVAKMAKQFTAKTINKNGIANCLQVVIERESKPALLARFGGESLKTEPFAVIEDIPLDLDIAPPRNELLTRLLADQCEICGSRSNIEVHHIRALADLQTRGQKELPMWKKIMASRKRKTLIVCDICHDDIHAGRPARKSPKQISSNP
jgi:group II intron reverse transcriptase/maturase